MENKLQAHEAELYKRIDEVLHYLWDPIGVSDQPAARDEYYSYLPQVFQLVRANAPKEKIMAFLSEITQHEMECGVNLKRDEAVIELLLKWRELIWEKYGAT
jgi:hypothetical protein